MTLRHRTPDINAQYFCFSRFPAPSRGIRIFCLRQHNSNNYDETINLIIISINIIYFFFVAVVVIIIEQWSPAFPLFVNIFHYNSF